MGLKSYLTIFRHNNNCYKIVNYGKTETENVHKINNQQHCKGKDWANS